MKLSQAIKTFIAWKTLATDDHTAMGYDRELRQFCLFLRNPDAGQITVDDVTTFLTGVAQLGWSWRGIAEKCKALRGFFAFCRRQGLAVLDEQLIPFPRKEFKIPRVAAEEDYQRLLGVIPRDSDPQHLRDRAILTMLWDTGMRAGELVSLNLGDIDFDRMRAVIKTEKSRGRRPFREVFWSPETNGYLAEWMDMRELLRVRDAEALFVCITGSNPGKRLSVGGLGEMLRRTSRKARIPYANAHSFRHRLGHAIVKNGGSAADVMNILGHASLASSTVYTMMTDRELEARYRLFKGW